MPKNKVVKGFKICPRCLQNKIINPDGSCRGGTEQVRENLTNSAGH